MWAETANILGGDRPEIGFTPPILRKVGGFVMQFEGLGEPQCGFLVSLKRLQMVVFGELQGSFLPSLSSPPEYSPCPDANEWYKCRSNN